MKTTKKRGRGRPMAKWRKIATFCHSLISVSCGYSGYSHRMTVLWLLADREASCPLLITEAKLPNVLLVDKRLSKPVRLWECPASRRWI
ncbi:hypothetical protein ElyMa_002691600 [Elysia marginata]|uniref:Uncharacterized protein n=1 Tax=Elysia marginata TaxID=1093978 RepID=A0AAV4HD27_9GAST|nr:hypothetical protein ElyMa_002691600 [Elysia marginata]